MNIAILGGTGKEGAGLATRWALVGHSIIIGSRDPERAKAKADELSETDHPIECDLLLCGADAAAKETVGELARSMGLRPIDVGALSNAGPLEGITAVLATINRRYKLKNSGIKITGL